MKIKKALAVLFSVTLGLCAFTGCGPAADGNSGSAGNDAPVFDDLDEKLADKKKADDVTSESVILRMCGAIVTESAKAGN